MLLLSVQRSVQPTLLGHTLSTLVFWDVPIQTPAALEAKKLGQSDLRGRGWEPKSISSPPQGPAMVLGTG